jgi:hypothetical protein
VRKNAGTVQPHHAARRSFYLTNKTQFLLDDRAGMASATELDVLVLNFSRFGVSERILWHLESVGKQIPRKLMWKVRCGAACASKPTPSGRPRRCA